MSNPIVAEDSYSVADQTPSPGVVGLRLDRKSILAQFQGDEELLRELIRLFQDDTPRLVEEARTALARNDASTLHRAAHTIKGSLGYFGATPAVEAAWQLETLAATGNLKEGVALLTRLEQALSFLQPELPRLLT
jgi:HPt (histidine-containing phosphotransfer) domain-containing protein